MERREFFTEGLRDCLTEMNTTINSMSIPEEPEEEEEVEEPFDYFGSFETCYPLLSEAPFSMFVDAAERLGIEVEGKSKLELAREVFAKEEER